MPAEPLPPTPDYEGLRAYIRAWMQRFYPGIPWQYGQIVSDRLPVPIHVVEYPSIVPLSPQASAPAPRQAESAEEANSGKSGLSSTTKAILKVLRAAGRPLTKTKLLEALEVAQQRGEIGDHVSLSESTVMRRVAELIADGTVENPEDARPRGYRLAE